MTKEQQKFYDIKKTTDYTEIGDDLDYKVYVDHDNQEVVLLFEETDSDRDWQNNFSILPWPLKLDGKTIWTTHGYARIYKSGNNQPMDEFTCKILEYPNYKVVLRGFSLGSAMTKIAARHFVMRFPYKQIDELTTYGDVKCWFNPFFSLKDKVERLREYVTANDAVTWFHLFFRRDTKNKVGPKFKLKEVFKSEWYHTHYEEYDYTKWE